MKPAVLVAVRMATVYRIVQKQNRHAVYASGFYSLARAEAWLATYNPQMWMDKTIQASDLEIIEEGAHPEASS